MPIHDKVGAARQIGELLNTLLKRGGFRLKYRITVDPPLPEDRDWEKPEILVELAGPDSPLLLERGGELLRSLEHVAIKTLRLESEEHEKISFDSSGFKKIRFEELRMAAEVAAERVRKSGVPYEFAPMSARERRILHLVFRDAGDLKTQSQGEGGRRWVVVYPKDYDPGRVAKPPLTRMRRRR